MTDIAKRLKELRADRGLSLAKLAKLVGISKTHMWELEMGRSKNPTLSIILGLCRVLEVTPNYLLGFDDLSLYGDGEKPAEGPNLVEIVFRNSDAINKVTIVLVEERASSDVIDWYRSYCCGDRITVEIDGVRVPE